MTEDSHFRALIGSGFKPQPIIPAEFLQSHPAENLARRARLPILPLLGLLGSDRWSRRWLGYSRRFRLGGFAGLHVFELLFSLGLLFVIELGGDFLDHFLGGFFAAFGSESGECPCFDGIRLGADALVEQAGERKGGGAVALVKIGRASCRERVSPYV